MNFIWGKTTTEYNQRLEFRLSIDKPCDTLTICAVDFYQVFLDGKLVSYGPARTAEGYSRPRRISVLGAKSVVIKIVSYGCTTYVCDKQPPFFSAELANGGKVVYTAEHFACYKVGSVVTDCPRYSGQRGFVELFDLTNTSQTPIETVAVNSPVIIDELEDFADYCTVEFEEIENGEFLGLKGKHSRSDEKTQTFNVQEDFIDKVKSGFRFIDYKCNAVHSGFIKIEGEAKEPCELFLLFDEVMDDGKYLFGRTSSFDFINVKVGTGKFSLITFEPYAFKYLKVLHNAKGQLSLTPSMITLENKYATCNVKMGETKFDTVIDAALNTFKQNALDIFMDCPSRERAGWLCDSYFIGKSEQLFCGNNKIERAFLENIIISTTNEIDKGMIPKCFPAEHTRNLYIPNWAMWFLVELQDYYERTGDSELIEWAKDKVYGVINYFKKYINEYGLLEDLRSWIFIEWSVSNDKEYVKGVNFPSNMIYALALDCAGKLYKDELLIEQAKKIKRQIKKLSFNGQFFCDNAVRIDGKLTRCDNHISETCQYYALFTGIQTDAAFKKKMIDEFGPFREPSVYSEIGKSNMFIGNYLRYFWLCDMGEYDRVIKESVDYFYKMASITGTLWEHDRTCASCNHGFASSAAVILNRCLLRK